MDFMGKFLQDLFFQEADELKKQLRRVFETRQKQVLEQPVPMGPKGRWFKLTCQPVCDKDRDVSTAGVWGREISESLRVRTALEKSEDRYRLLADNATEMICTHDPDGICTYISPACQKLVGYPPDNLTGRLIYDFIHPDDMDAINEGIDKIINKGATLTVSHRLLHKSGQYIWVETWGRAVLHQKTNAVKEVITVTRDIAELKRADDRLRESEEKYRGIFENAVEGFFQSTPAGRFISVNPAFARILGYASPYDMVESIRDIATQYYADPKDRRQYREILKKNGAIQNFEFKVKRKNGSLIWVSNSTRAIYDTSGEIIRYEGVVKDITRQKQAEREKETLQKQLNAARKMESMGTLAGGVAHEFNNILGIIIGNTELALEDIPEWNNAKSFVREIKAASMRAKEVVQRILRFVQKLPSEKKTIPFAKTVVESLELIRATVPKPIQIQWDLQCGSCDLILADPTEINQMIMNLSANSVHAVGNSGTISVILKRVVLSDPVPAPFKALAPGHYMKLTFKDDGRGMAPEVLDRVFEPYFTTKQVNEGLGMGLAVVYGIVKNSDGAIDVQSQVGRGTTVEILIPVHEAKADNDREGPGRAKKKARILFVDDEAAIADAVRILLTRAGYRVVSETHPEKALARFCESPGDFDLVITDMAMPGISGDRLARRIKEIRPHVPVILCTGYSEQIDAAMIRESGIFMVITKPLDKKELTHIVSHVLQHAVL